MTQEHTQQSIVEACRRAGEKLVRGVPLTWAEQHMFGACVRDSMAVVVENLAGLRYAKEDQQ